MDMGETIKEEGRRNHTGGYTDENMGGGEEMGGGDEEIGGKRKKSRRRK